MKKNEEIIKIEEPLHLSRLLYPNPVCLLTSWSKKENKQNIMTISWLTPINNKGTFIASMNKKRYTSKLVIEEKKFSKNQK
jgi:flavin reductase (DIM6/NTAB) family NADH-FMN oxidoreductase RutF